LGGVSWSPELLFNTGHLEAGLDEHQSKVSAKVRKIDADRILSTPVEDLVDEIFNEFVVNPIELDMAAKSSPGVKDAPMKVQGYERMIEVDGSRVELHIPFNGDSELFKMRPSQFTLNPPRLEVRGKVLVAAFEGRAPLDPAAARASLDRQVSDTEQWIGLQRPSIDRFNDELENLARTAIETRRAKVLKDRQLESFLDVPVQARPDAAKSIVTGPVRRRPNPAAKASTPFAPEPALSDETFGEIIDVIRATTHIMERLPATASAMGEESLRDHLLIGLNHQFGPATGETFNGRGKTDIYIPVDGSDGSVFIAECKIWKGPAGIGKAIDQLLGYLTWRDTKAALIVFQRRGSPTDVWAKIVDAVRAHPSYKRDRGVEGTVFTLAADSDESREIHLAVLHVPVLGSGE